MKQMQLRDQNNQQEKDQKEHPTERVDQRTPTLFSSEAAEMEARVGDEPINVDPLTREGELVRIIRHLRDQVNVALAHQHFDDAADIQTTLTSVLEAAGENPNLTLQLARQVTGVYQRLYRRCRNRGNRELSSMYYRFANDLHSFL